MASVGVFSRGGTAGLAKKSSSSLVVAMTSVDGWRLRPKVALHTKPHKIRMVRVAYAFWVYYLGLAKSDTLVRGRS